MTVSRLVLDTVTLVVPGEGHVVANLETSAVKSRKTVKSRKSVKSRKTAKTVKSMKSRKSRQSMKSRKSPPWP